MAPSTSTTRASSSKRPHASVDEDDALAGTTEEEEDDPLSGTTEDEDEPSPPPPPKKKAKKVLTKKVAVWSDIKKWKEGDDPLGRFPVEILDLIINVDADLDLRDHLALAGMCRYFRACYTDVVFQVLYQSKRPLSTNPAHKIQIDDTGREPYYSYGGGYGRESVFIGPVLRSWNEARWLFSSSKVPRDGWGVVNEQWEGSDAQLAEAQEMDALKAFLTSEREKKQPEIEAEVKIKDEIAVEAYNKRYAEWESDTETANLQRHAAGEMLVWNEWTGPRKPYKAATAGEYGIAREMDRLLEADMEVYGKWVKPEEHVPYHAISSCKYKRPEPVAESTARDPWASEWRRVCAEVVNKPRISKTDAKSTLKVSDRELLGLKLVHQWPGWPRGQPKHYIKSAVEALSLRSHGGAGGHKAYLEKLEVRKSKAHATRVKNGTLKVAKPKPNRYNYGWDLDDEMDAELYLAYMEERAGMF